MPSVKPRVVQASNERAEKAFIGALLRSPHDYWAICSVVRADSFGDLRYREVFSAIAGIQESGKAFSLALLASRLPDELDAGQSTVPLLSVLAHNADGLSALDFVEEIVDAASRRKLVHAGEALIRSAKGDGSPLDAAADAQTAILDVMRINGAQHIMQIGEVAERVVKEVSEAYAGTRRCGFDTGINAIDEIIGPLMPGDLVSLIGQSGHGKTTLATQVLMRASDPSLDTNRGCKSFFISQEMTSTQIVRRILAGETGISTRNQRSGEVNTAEFETLDSRARGLRSLPIFIDGSGRQTMSQIANKCRSMKRMHGIAFVAIDHVKLIRTSNPRWSDIDIIANAAMELKDLAKELEVVILLLAQPTREAQKRDSWRIRDQDIYGGDVVKQCSEIVMSISIPVKWLRQREPDESDVKARDKWVRDCTLWAEKAEIGVLKARDGDDGLWRTLSFDGRKVQFSDPR